MFHNLCKVECWLAFTDSTCISFFMSNKMSMLDITCDDLHFAEASVGSIQLLWPNSLSFYRASSFPLYGSNIAITGLKSLGFFVKLTQIGQRCQDSKIMLQKHYLWKKKVKKKIFVIIFSKEKTMHFISFKYFYSFRVWRVSVNFSVELDCILWD